MRPLGHAYKVFSYMTLDITLSPLYRINGQEAPAMPGLIALTPPRTPSPARGREQDPVETAEPRTLHLPLEHLHLVPEHQELDVLLICPATSDSEEAADQEVQE